MREQPERAADEAPGSLVVLAVLSLCVGTAAGLVGAAFRLSLERADLWRNAALCWTHGLGRAGLILAVTAVAAATALAAWLVRRFSPHASGSGIPHVEAVLNRKLPPAPFRLVPVKFAGGLLAIGSGLALGREGPSVQMGATLAHLIGLGCRRTLPDCLALLAAGAGAGLATAFNAPIAGAVFVLEELVRRFDAQVAVATFGASAGAIAVGRVFLGDSPDFQVGPLPYPGFGTVPIHLALGILAGLLGVAYNRVLLATLAGAERLRGWPVEVRAALLGATVGLVAWIAPDLVGGGDPLTQRTLAGDETLTWVALVFLCRFGLGPLCYAARTPGGLFAPMLVLGAQAGFLFGTLCNHWLGDFSPAPRALSIVGMAAFFTAVVRAPLTGIVLVIELTGSFTVLLPMLSACFAAMLVPTVLGEAPIYDSLRANGG
jgi:CIC family chloride channel protein